MNPMEIKEKSAAVLTLNNVPIWTQADKKKIADWLRRQAKDLMKYGNQYNKKMIARYRYSI